MRTLIAPPAQMSLRRLRALWRQPWFLAVILAQPVLWLLVFGPLFKKVVDIPGFHSNSYIDYLTPGIVVMTALFTAGWSGMPLVRDQDRGILDRFLVSPLPRWPLIVGPLISVSATIVLQELIIVALALAIGASFPGGPAGVVLLVVCALLLGLAVGAASHGLALVARKEETLIGVVNFLILPLTFLSTAFMQSSLIPGWIRAFARVNPVNWAVEAARSAVSSHVDWSLVGSRCGYLVALAIVCAWLATRAFRAYEKSL